MLECERIHPNLHEENIWLPEALGCKGRTEEVNFKAVQVSKKKIRMLVYEKQRGEYCLVQLPPVTEKKYFVPNKFFVPAFSTTSIKPRIQKNRYISFLFC